MSSCFEINFFNPDIFIEEVTDFADKFHLKSDRQRNRRNSRRDRTGRSGSRSGSTGDRRRLGRRKTRTDEKGWPGTSWSRGSWFFWQLPEPKDRPRFSIARERKRKETELRFEGSQQPAVGRKKVDSSKLARSGVIPTVQASSGATEPSPVWSTSARPSSWPWPWSPSSLLSASLSPFRFDVWNLLKLWQPFVAWLFVVVDPA